MSWDPNTPNTGAAMSAADAASVRLLWQRTVDIFDQSEDWMKKYEGTSKDSCIRVIDDTSKGRGMTMTVTVRAGYYGPGKSGDALFTAVDDFEPDNISSYKVVVDYLRNATSINDRTDELMGMQGELASGQAEELGKWMGREKTSRAMMMFRLRGGPQNLIIAGGYSTDDSIKSADHLTYNSILQMGQALKPLGGMPCKVATIKGSKVLKYCISGVTPGLFSLRQDPAYQLLVENAGPRENYDANPLWSGGYMEVDGHRIVEENPIDHDGFGPVGSAFNAKAFLGAAIVAGTTVFDMLGGGSAKAATYTKIQYFRFFPNYAFEFLPSDIYTPGTAVKYMLVVNPSNAPTDPNKIGMYSYTVGNVGTKITILQRLGAAASGARVTTLGNVVWNTGVWSGLHTDVHPIGATVIHCNANGVPIGDTIMMGAGAMVRGYGKDRNKRGQWFVDDFETRKYIRSVFGQVLRTNVRGVIPGYVRLRHAISYPELPIPVVT